MKSFSDSSAERYLIGALVSSGFAVVADLGISPFEFSDAVAQRIWIAGEALHAEGRPCTYLGIAARLEVPAQQVLAAGSEDGATAIRPVLEDCAARLRECYVRRRAMGIGKELTEGCDLAVARQKLDRLIQGAPGAGGVEALFADVPTLIANGLQVEKPSVADLLYPGRISEIHGEPSVGKTNVQLALALVTMRDGGHVLYLDPEDTAQSAIRRLIAFGARQDELTERFHHVVSPSPGDFPALASWARRVKPRLVIVDGLAESLASLGLDEDKVSDFLAFCRNQLQPFTESGAAVLVADHVAKSTEGRGRWARGTGAKLGRYDGVSYSAELGKPYSPKVAGFVRLVVAKDRNGGVGVIGEEIAEVHFSPHDRGTRIDFRKPTEASEFMPTALMERVSKHLEAHPGASKRDLRGIGGRAKFIDLAIEKLEELEHIEVMPGGIGRPSQFKLLKAFREASHE